MTFDVGERKSFENIERWQEDVRKIRGSDALIMIVANKIDLENRFLIWIRKVTTEEAENRAKELDCHYIEVSAMTGENVGLMFQTIGEMLPVSDTSQMLSAASSSSKIILWRC